MGTSTGSLQGTGAAAASQPPHALQVLLPVLFDCFDFISVVLFSLRLQIIKVITYWSISK